MTLVRHMLYAQSSDPATLQEQAKFSKYKKKKRRNRFPQERILAFSFLDLIGLGCCCRALRHTDGCRNPGRQSRCRINLQLQLKQRRRRAHEGSMFPLIYPLEGSESDPLFRPSVWFPGRTRQKTEMKRVDILSVPS